MSSRKIYTLAFFCLLASFGFSQQVPCGMDQVQQQLMNQNPNYEAEITHYINEVLPRINPTEGNARAVITIPVVVHVIHTGQAIGNGANVSTDRIQSQIDALNEDYRRTNNDSNETPSQYQDIAADTEIQFCLAAFDPGDAVTNGITRHVYSNVPDIDYIENTIKPETSWDPDRYLNIWTIEMPSSSSTILGYSYLPTQTIVGFPRDGVVINYTNFGFVNSTNQGRTCVHEVGHYLGLQHTWGAADSNGDPIGCNSDDGVSDTPNCSAPHYGCPSFGLSSCGSTDMTMNYMEYVNDNCMNVFTEGQKAVMQSTLSGLRSSLSTSSASACENIDGSCNNLTVNSIQMGFEAGQSTNGWLIENANNDTRTWLITQTSTNDWGPNSGEGSAVYLWNTNGTTSGDDYLFSPCFDILSNHTYKLSFSYACAQDGGTVFTERLEVGLSEEQSSEDFDIPNDNWIFDVSNAYPDYNDISFTFQPSSSGTTSVGFHAISDADKYALQIDDINIQDLGLSSPVSELSTSSFIQSKPNPTTGLTTLSLDFENTQKLVEINIYNVLGKVVKYRSLDNLQKGQIELNLSDLEDGIYFVMVKADGIMLSEKIILSND